MNRALAYGLMGAASGVLHGVYDQWQQNQDDIRTQKLAQAKWQETVALKKMEAQFDSQTNLAKVQMQLQADVQRDAANNQAKSALQTQKDAADASLQTVKDKAALQRANISAGATIDAAKIHAADAGQVKPRLVAVKDKSGGISVQAVQPGDQFAPGSQFMNFNGDPQFAPMPVGLLGNFGTGGASTTVGNPASTDVSSAAGAAPAPAAPQPTAATSPYPDGTQLTGPNGAPYVVRNGVPVPAGQ